MKSEIATALLGCVLVGFAFSFAYYGLALGSGYSPQDAIRVAVVVALAPAAIVAAMFALSRLAPVQRFLRRHLGESGKLPQGGRARSLADRVLPARPRSDSPLRIAFAHSFRAIGLLVLLLVPAAAFLEAKATGFLFPVRGFSGIGIFFVAVSCYLITGGCFWLAERIEYPPQ